MKYTFSDEEDAISDAGSNRRSNRHSGMAIAAGPSGPTFTASGRQVRSRYGGAYGETVLSGQDNLDEQNRGSLGGAIDDETEKAPHARPHRSVQYSTILSKGPASKQHKGYESLDPVDDESDATTSGREWEGGDSEEPDEPLEEEEDDDGIETSNSNDGEEEDPRQSLVVSLRYMRSISIPSIEGNRKDIGPTKNLSAALSLNSSDPRQSQLSNTTHPSTDVSKADVRKESQGDRQASSEAAVGGLSSIHASSQVMPERHRAQKSTLDGKLHFT